MNLEASKAGKLEVTTMDKSPFWFLITPDESNLANMSFTVKVPYARGEANLGFQVRFLILSISNFLQLDKAKETLTKVNTKKRISKKNDCFYNNLTKIKNIFTT